MCCSRRFRFRIRPIQCSLYWPITCGRELSLFIQYMQLLLLTFLFNKNMGQSCITEDFVASLAQLLNTAQVPCVLWGHVLLRTHGVPTIVGVSVPSPPLFPQVHRIFTIIQGSRFCGPR